MKAAFGLVGILAVVGVIVWIMGKSGGGLDYVKEEKQAGDRGTADVNQIAGKARDGEMTFKESIKVDGQSAGGKTVALLVEKVESAGPAATYFGLTRGDLVTEIGPLPVKEMGDSDAALDYLMDAYQRKQTITVVRDDIKITLPGGLPAPGQVIPVQPAQAPKPKDDRGSLQRQLDNVTGAGQKPGGN